MPGFCFEFDGPGLDAGTILSCYVFIRIFVCVYIYIYMYNARVICNIYIYIYIYVCVCVCVCTIHYVRMYAFTYAIYIYIYIYIYKYIYIYTHTHCIVGYYSPNIIRVAKERKMRWAGNMARMGEKRNACRVLVGKLVLKRPLGRLRR